MTPRTIDPLLPALALALGWAAPALGQPGRGAAFACAVRAVTDGDTLRCRDGTRVRLAGIDAPELPGHCRRGRACAPGDPYAARRELQRLVAGRTITCRATGMSYGRVTAWCRTLGGVDLSCAMVASGRAVRWARYWRGRQNMC